MYDYVGLCMTMYDYVWPCMTIYDYAWLCLTMYEYVWLSMRERKRASLKTFSFFSIFLKLLEIFKQFKFCPMIQMFSNCSYSSTNLDFVYLCLPLFNWRIYAQILCLFLKCSGCFSVAYSKWFFWSPVILKTELQSLLALIHLWK